MKHKIDPRIDCVFKALLGSIENRNLLIHFLNAIIVNTSPDKKIVSVEILNPYNEKEFISDKLSIVDIKAKDDRERIYQVEIQMVPYAALQKRILYSWSDIYSSQLKSGEDYKELNQVISIWILCERLIKESDSFYYHFQAYDAKNKIVLHEDCSIHILELEKFIKKEISNELERWLMFFKAGESLDYENLPDFMKTKEMGQAMNTLIAFSEKEREYHLYQSRINYLREQKTIARELEEERRGREEERKAKEEALELVKQLQEKLKERE